MNARKEVFLATYVVAAGAMLAAFPQPLLADETCYSSWVGCLEGLSIHPCAPQEIGYCDDGGSCKTGEWHIVCKAPE